MTYDAACVACKKPYRVSGFDSGFCSVGCWMESLPTSDDVIPSPGSARVAKSYRVSRTADNADDAALLLLREYERLRAALPAAEGARFDALVLTALEGAATDEEPTP